MLYTSTFCVMIEAHTSYFTVVITGGHTRTNKEAKPMSSAICSKQTLVQSIVSDYLIETRERHIS